MRKSLHYDLTDVDIDPGADGHPHEINFIRALTTGMLGILMNGGSLTIYYRVLDRLFGASR